MQLFFLPDLTLNNKTADFNKDESKHIFKVLRKEIGDDLTNVVGLENREVGMIE